MQRPEGQGGELAPTAWFCGGTLGQESALNSFGITIPLQLVASILPRSANHQATGDLWGEQLWGPLAAGP